MTEPSTIRYGGGWGSTYPNMSPGLQMRIAQADAEYERDGARQERARAELAAIDEEARVRASIEQAIARGEAVDVRRAYRDGGIGRTPREAIEYASAVADVDDMKMEAIRAKAERDFNAAYYGDAAADTSAPIPVDAETQARADAFRAKVRDEIEAKKAKVRERADIIRLARQGAAWDRDREIVR
jgi:hypothetical protein